jgi:hypothetical protein
MTCGCKHKKKGSGSSFLSGATWKGYGPYKQGHGFSYHGSGLAKKKRRRKARKPGPGAVFTGSGINFAGSGYVFEGSGFKRRVGARIKK